MHRDLGGELGIAEHDDVGELDLDEAKDAGRPVATAMRNAAPVTGWSDNVIELAGAEPIARVRIDCDPISPLIFDQLTWR